ncbi:MAG: hypothetical protein HY858_12290 [Candidatus Solibacter usitatus]|nr:hypothetical protein [Candidatus Solibacter usitatus]
MTHWLALAMLAAGAPQAAPQPGPFAAACADSEIADFGLECTAEEPCPVYLELAGVEAAGTRIFLAGNLHTESVTLWSLLLMSDDGGVTWTEPHPRIRGVSLDQVAFVDLENGWASGYVTGSIPKDPFLLKTADGGKTWRRIPLFEDTAFASIEQFWFETKARGFLILNRRGASGGRYQKMESMTGGDSWMMREVSPTPIAAPRPRSGADWRIRIDSPTRTFRVERRAGARWEPAGAFPIRAGACKPAPPPPPPPQPEPPKEPPPQ